MNLPNGVTQRIILVRHGEPTETAHGRCYGKLDVGLSEIGKQQIVKAMEFLQGVEFEQIYASPRSRARESAEIIAAKNSLIYQVENNLAEIDFGDFEGLTYQEVEQKFPEIYRKWMETPTKVEFPNGESFSQMQARVLQTTENLRHQNEGKTFVIVAHGGVNRIILAHYLQIQAEHIFRLEQNYASVNVIDFYGEFPVVRILNQTAENSWR